MTKSYISPSIRCVEANLRESMNDISFQKDKMKRLDHVVFDSKKRDGFYDEDDEISNAYYTNYDNLW